jgi:hypothetical protein
MTLILGTSQAEILSMTEPVRRSVTGITNDRFHGNSGSPRAGRPPYNILYSLPFRLCGARRWRARARSDFDAGVRPKPADTGLIVCFGPGAVAMFGRLRPNMDLRYHACGAGSGPIQIYSCRRLPECVTCLE